VRPAGYRFSNEPHYGCRVYRVTLAGCAGWLDEIKYRFAPSLARDYFAHTHTHTRDAMPPDARPSIIERTLLRCSVHATLHRRFTDRSLGALQRLINSEKYSGRYVGSLPVQAGVYRRVVTLSSLLAVSRSRPFDLFAYCLSVCLCVCVCVAFCGDVLPFLFNHVCVRPVNDTQVPGRAALLPVTIQLQCMMMASLSSFFPSRREYRFNLVERRTL